MSRWIAQPGLLLELDSLAPRGVELVAVRSSFTDEEQPRRIEHATLCLSPKGPQKLLSKLEKYATDKPKELKEIRHEKTFDPVAGLGLATLRSLWTDDDGLYPAPNEKIWWEIWLRRQDGRELERFFDFASQTELRTISRRLQFDQRVVTLAWGTPEQMALSLDVLTDVAEVRRAAVTAQFFDSARPNEQAEWVAGLLHQMVEPPEDAPAVTIMDTGVNRGHPLLRVALRESNCLTCEINWGVADHHGHGTEMAGLALYGDFTHILGNSTGLRLRHQLESVKLLPPRGQNDPQLWGAITADATSRAEIAAPTRTRVFCLATTSADSRDRGQPSSWSTALDALAAGRSFDASQQGLVYLDELGDSLQRRLFVVCAGNVADDKIGVGHLDRSDLEQVQEPAQAWNALTVGAHTEMAEISDPSLAGWLPLAAAGDLCPWSTTSVSFFEDWPIKPEVVFEGGNAASNGDEAYSCPDLSLLTTHYVPTERAFTISWATSPATAQVARMGALISADYPDLGPESVRALIVHSARWTPAMVAQFI